MMGIWRERSARNLSLNGLADPSNPPQIMRTRKTNTKKNMSVPLYIQQKKANPEMKKMEVVRTTGKTMGSTTVKTPCYTMPKTTRKKPHQHTKANRHCQNCQRVQKNKMNMTT